jgi:hypothetical protein
MWPATVCGTAHNGRHPNMMVWPARHYVSFPACLLTLPPILPITFSRLQMAQSATEVRDAAADKATELKDKAADKAGEVRGCWQNSLAHCCHVSYDITPWTVQCPTSAADHQAGRVLAARYPCSNPCDYKCTLLLLGLPWLIVRSSFTYSTGADRVCPTLCCPAGVWACPGEP